MGQRDDKFGRLLNSILGHQMVSSWSPPPQIEESQPFPDTPHPAPRPAYENLKKWYAGRELGDGRDLTALGPQFERGMRDMWDAMPDGVRGLRRRRAMGKGGSALAELLRQESGPDGTDMPSRVIRDNRDAAFDSNRLKDHMLAIHNSNMVDWRSYPDPEEYRRAVRSLARKMLQRDGHDV